MSILLLSSSTSASAKSPTDPPYLTIKLEISEFASPSSCSNCLLSWSQIKKSAPPLEGCPEAKLSSSKLVTEASVPLLTFQKLSKYSGPDVNLHSYSANVPPIVESEPFTQEFFPASKVNAATAVASSAVFTYAR